MQSPLKKFPSTYTLKMCAGKISFTRPGNKERKTLPFMPTNNSEDFLSAISRMGSYLGVGSYSGVGSCILRVGLYSRVDFTLQ